MFPRHLGYEIVVLTTICTVAIFLFPAASGPYSAVHGPVTALLSFRLRLKFCLGMALAALRSLGGALVSSFQATWQEIFSPQLVPPRQMAVLRC